MRMRNRTAALTTGATVAAAGLLATVAAAPAQAYDPNPKAWVTTTSTDNCPCTDGDLIDGTYFQKDVGGRGVKILATKRDDVSVILGKVEFHPAGEKLWVYDTRNDGDALYATVEYYSGGKKVVKGPYKAPGTPKRIDKTTIDLSIPEGTYVTVKLYDGKGTDLIKSAGGRA
ncbi:hypothetical protein QCN29_10430 [Streptomyces sp. HNM0663]|uniref:Secreted protein n=1 Tax=Streptomyces chengmaiensis TaxID=3040919 RepID=A0ABT6HKG5_9ACTN|nr:hypothetical protein [Streptomyces chengmaiensis]MDH2389198.1 hypothetical protein [Streptomyces chengmaiensis]